MYSQGATKNLTVKMTVSYSYKCYSFWCLTSFFLQLNILHHVQNSNRMNE